MERQEIIIRLKEIVQPYTTNHDAIDNLDESTDFIKDLQINSANLVDIVLDIEEAFDIVIDNESMEIMLNVRVTIDMIESKRAEK